MKGSTVTEKSQTSTTEENALLAAQIASDRLATNVLLLDISEVSSYTDYFLIATGETKRHLNFLADRIINDLRDKSKRIDHREGDGSSGWILLDFGDLIVNLFTAEQREHYALEELWSEGREVLQLE